MGSSEPALASFKGMIGIYIPIIPLKGARRSQERPGGPGGARKGQEEPGGQSNARVWLKCALAELHGFTGHWAPFKALKRLVEPLWALSAS